MTEISFFGWETSVSEIWLMIVVMGGGALWSGHELRKAVKFGKVGFKGRDYCRDEDRFSFNLYVGLWSVMLFCSLAGLIGWYFDFGMKP